jgi:hypothetical protein
VVVDRHRKTVMQAVPDLPDEGAMLEELAVLDEKPVPQLALQGFARVVGCFQQLGKPVRAPGFAISRGQQVGWIE